MGHRWSDRRLRRNDSDDDPAVLALDCEFPTFAARIRAGDGGKSRFADQQLTGRRRCLDALRHVHRIADNREVQETLATDIADERQPGIDAYADRQRMVTVVVPRLREIAKQGSTRLDRRFLEVGSRKSGHEERHHFVTHQLVDRRVMTNQRVVAIR